MLDRSAWAGLIPHAGPMALISRVRHHDAGAILAEGVDPGDPAHPLRRDGRLHAVHLCEYGAQAMAVHGALVAQASGGRARPGLLVALRSVRLAVTYIDDLAGALEIAAQREQADATAWRYRFAVRHDGRELASGQALVMLERETTT